jgi:hypothetical protein
MRIEGELSDTGVDDEDVPEDTLARHFLRIIGTANIMVLDLMAAIESGEHDPIE